MVESRVYGIRQPDVDSAYNTYKLCDLSEGINFSVPQSLHQQRRRILVSPSKNCYETKFILTYYCYYCV